MSRASRALGHVFGQRRRYAVVGVLTYRGPLTAASIALLVRSPAFVVRRDLAKIQRAGLIAAVDDGLIASLDEPAVPNERTRDAARRLNAAWAAGI